MKNFKIKANIVIMMVLAVCVSFSFASCGGGNKSDKKAADNIENVAPLSLVYYTDDNFEGLETTAEWKENATELFFGYYLPKRNVVVAARTGAVPGLKSTTWPTVKKFLENITLDGRALSLPSKDVFANWGADDDSLMEEQRAFLYEKGMKFALGNYGSLWCKEEAQKKSDAYYFDLKDKRLDTAFKTYPDAKDRVVFQIAE